MPNYTYKCHKCGKVEEVIHRMDKATTVFCINCPDKTEMVKCLSSNYTIKFLGKMGEK